jgi:acyl-CoA reductase-like NAD-dependent aldehyde dehydrogenase
MTNRTSILKTYKIFIGGKFPRSESGRVYKLKVNEKAIANICLSSRKDVKNAVVAARNSFDKWSNASAYNRSQVLYRIAEMIEGRKSQLIEDLILQGIEKKPALEEVNLSIDRVIYFAGWADKINQVFGSVNPVSSSYFNFSQLEPMGVVGLICSERPSLLALISALCPIIVSGNTAVVIASESLPICAISLAEVFANSDVPPGVVNILTGSKKEIRLDLAKHMDVNALYLCDNNAESNKSNQIAAADNLKRIILPNNYNWYQNSLESPYEIIRFMETKTTWHPIENISSSGTGY